MHIYEGVFDAAGYDVTIDGHEFSASRSLLVREHSPTGFAWGYGGSGPAQLALAILLEETDQENAEALYHLFKWDWIAQLPREWTMSSSVVKAWLLAHAR